MLMALNAIRADVDRLWARHKPSGFVPKEAVSPAPLPKKSDPEGGYRGKNKLPFREAEKITAISFRKG